MHNTWVRRAGTSGVCISTILTRTSGRVCISTTLTLVNLQVGKERWKKSLQKQHKTRPKQTHRATSQHKHTHKHTQHTQAQRSQTQTQPQTRARTRPTHQTHEQKKTLERTILFVVLRLTSIRCCSYSFGTHHSIAVPFGTDGFKSDSARPARFTRSTTTRAM